MRITIAALDLATEPRIVRDEAGVIIALAEEREVVEAIVSETQRYSITPTTFLEREFEERVDNWWYIDRYGVGDNIAVRFGINSETREVAEAITRLPRDMGVSSSGNTYKLRDAKKIMLSMIEEQLLQKAIRYLMESPQHHAALVDILVRENGGANNGAVKQVDGVPETHTVVLYKNPTAHDEVAADLVVAAAFAATDIQPILVIDPNNFLFSSHLSNLGNGAAYLGCKIVTVHLKTQIYTPNLEVGIGPLQSQYRDCINIAVQIARGLNETMPDLIGTASDATALDALITGCLAIRSLSNSTDIDKNIMVEDAPVRIKQRTDTNVVQAFNAVEKLVMDSYEIICKKSDRIASLLEGDINTILQDSSLSDYNIIRSLCHHNDTHMLWLHQTSLQETREVLGMVAHLVERIESEEL